MFGNLRKRIATNRLVEEKVYQQVLHEIEAGQVREGLWAKALSNSNGKKKKAKSLYISYRVQSLIDQAVLTADHLQAKRRGEELRIKEVNENALAKIRLEKQQINKAIEDNASEFNRRRGGAWGYTKIAVPKSKNSSGLQWLLIIFTFGVLIFYFAAIF